MRPTKLIQGRASVEAQKVKLQKALQILHPVILERGSKSNLELVISAYMLTLILMPMMGNELATPRL